MLYEDNNIKQYQISLSKQKLNFKRNNVKSLKNNQKSWHQYMHKTSKFKKYLEYYLSLVEADVKNTVYRHWYESRSSEAYYYYICIGNIKKNIRIANHDSPRGKYDVEIKLSECNSMKSLYKKMIETVDRVVIQWKENFIDMNNYTHFYNSALRKLQERDTLVENLNSLLSQREETESKLKELLYTHRIYEDAIEYLKEIIELIGRRHINHIEKLLNSAVSTIFYDKNYSIKLEIVEYKNSNALNILLIETTDKGDIVTNIKDNGFGIQCIVGFILQVYFILYYKLEPILLADEAMSNLSSQYIPYFKRLLDALVKQYNFIFVLVAHDERYIDIADYKYEVKDGEVRKI